MQNDTLYVRKVQPTEGPASLDLDYCVTHRTSEWKQTHYFETFDDVICFLQNVLLIGTVDER